MSPICDISNPTKETELKDNFRNKRKKNLPIFKAIYPSINADESIAEPETFLCKVIKFSFKINSASNSKNKTNKLPRLKEESATATENQHAPVEDLHDTNTWHPDMVKPARLTI